MLHHKTTYIHVDILCECNPCSLGPALTWIVLTKDTHVGFTPFGASSDLRLLGPRAMKRLGKRVLMEFGDLLPMTGKLKDHRSWQSRMKPSDQKPGVLLRPRMPRLRIAPAVMEGSACWQSLKCNDS